jgi:hypothetical protein
MTGPTWDTTLQVGELITAYEAGYHILLEVGEPRGPYAPLIKYRRVVSANGALIKTKKPVTLTCDASFAIRVTKESIAQLYAADIMAATARRDNLLGFATR